MQCQEPFFNLYILVLLVLMKCCTKFWTVFDELGVKCDLISKTGIFFLTFVNDVVTCYCYGKGDW